MSAWSASSPSRTPAPSPFHKGKRLEVLAAVVSEGRYGGTPGRIFYHEGDGVVIAAGADARNGRNHGLAITHVRTEDGQELPATEYFTCMGGYLTNRPWPTTPDPPTPPRSQGPAGGRRREDPSPRGGATSDAPGSPP